LRKIQLLCTYIVVFFYGHLICKPFDMERIIIESIMTMSIGGLLAGFILSMPVAGPISVIITSNAFNGRLRYCNLVNLGASIADFTYVFIAVFGLTKLYSVYQPLIPYILLLGSVLLFYLGYKIYRTKIDIEHLEDKSHLLEKIKIREKGAFYTGFMINFLNPTLFFGWLTSSLLVITLISSMGFYTGGLAKEIGESVNKISNIEGRQVSKTEGAVMGRFDNIQALNKKDKKEELIVFPEHFHLVISLCYAFFVAVGSICWFLVLTFFIVTHRKKINIKLVSVFIKSSGIFLSLFGIYFVYIAAKMILRS
jgi:threonine/homoserine/homoserine lactone efflux protein